MGSILMSKNLKTISRCARKCAAGVYAHKDEPKYFYQLPEMIQRCSARRVVNSMGAEALSFAIYLL